MAGLSKIVTTSHKNPQGGTQMPPKKYEREGPGSIGEGDARGNAHTRSTRVQLEREAKTTAKIDMSRCLAAASGLEPEDCSPYANIKSSDSAWMRSGSIKSQEPGQGHRRYANAFTVVFPRRKSGQSCRMISQPVIISPDVLRHYSQLPLSGVAKVLGISLTAIKKACRSVGVTRWPHCSPNGAEISDSNTISRTCSSDEEYNAEPAMSQLKVAQDVASGMINGRRHVPMAVTSSSTFCFTSIQSEVTGATPQARSSTLPCQNLPRMPHSGPRKPSRGSKGSVKRTPNYLNVLSPNSKAVAAWGSGKKRPESAGQVAFNYGGLNEDGHNGQQSNYDSTVADERRGGSAASNTVSAEESREAYIAHLEMKLQEATACPLQPPLKRVRRQASLTGWSSGRKVQEEVMDTGGQWDGMSNPRYPMEVHYPAFSKQDCSADQDSFSDERGIPGGGCRDIPASLWKYCRPGSLAEGLMAESVVSSSGIDAMHGWAQYLRESGENVIGGSAGLNFASSSSPQQSPRPYTTDAAAMMDCSIGGKGTCHYSANSSNATKLSLISYD